MLYLNEKDISKCISFDDVMDAIEEAYKIYGENKFHMPPRIHKDYKNKTLLYMPCFIDDVFGTKILTVFPENKKMDKPVIDGLMLLNDYTTGEPLAMIDGKYLTALRTGAVGGVGVRHTTPDSIKSAGLVGAGVQGFYQLLYACRARAIDKIKVFDVSKDKIPSFIKKLKIELPNVEISEAGSIEELLEASELVITTTTANEPVLPEKKELLEGKHFIGIGSYKPTMREYPEVIFSLLDELYVDTEHALEETGDLMYPLDKGIFTKDKIKGFSQYLLCEKNKDDIVKKTTFFKSVGMGLFDIVVSRLIYDKAKEAGVGQRITL
ncbi:MAG: ornithine cyclodeaminase family protein [Clostridiaceae bacterium]|nr:ornithine cyclodeaminase family protein [Clostridiaceae bacterium]